MMPCFIRSSTLFASCKVLFAIPFNCVMIGAGVPPVANRPRQLRSS
jgi:hypothetical protein